MMIFRKVLFFLLLMSSLGSLYSDDFDIAAERIAARTGRVKAEIAAAILQSMKADGTWGDIDYTSKNTSMWSTCHHLSRKALPLAEHYRDTKDRRYADAAKKALFRWIDMKLVNPNWWWNVVGAPMNFSDSAICLYDTLSPDERKKFADYLEVCQLSDRAEGMNALWFASIVMKRAILRKDDALMKKALTYAVAEMNVAPDDREGIKRDWSFQQHGRMEQFGNYGCSFISELPIMFEVLDGTRWALPDSSRDNIQHLLSDGFRWVVFRGSLDVTSCGRQNLAGCQRGKGRAILNAMERFRQLGMEIPLEEPVGFKNFFLSGHTIYRTKYWMGAIRMSNQQIDGVETTCNYENMKGGHLADGSLFLYSTGDEYRDIYPLWGNWRLLPGVTTYLELPPVRTSKRCNRDNFIFAEGNAMRAIVKFRLDREGLRAEKTWTFTPAGVHCTGAGITGTHKTARVVTCVENNLAGPDAVIYPYKDGRLTAVNNGKTYIITAPEKMIHAEISEREGDWKEIHGNHPSKKHKGRLFTLWIDHGIRPQNANYSYEVLINSKRKSSADDR